MSTDSTDSQRAARLNITVRPETFARLQEARNKKGIEINVSQVADAAINAQLDRLEKPGIADVIARLRVESDLRRGVPYRWGHPEGVRWAREVASWAEICRWAMTYEETDVGIVTAEGGDRIWPAFVGKFRAPDDYRSAPSYRDEAGPVDDAGACEQFWRGWLAGVKEIFEKVRVELEPIEPYPPVSLPQPVPETTAVPTPPSTETVSALPQNRDVDPNLIQFR